MRRCPQCGMYMNNRIEPIFGDWILAYECICGYENTESMAYSDKTLYICGD